MFELLALQVKNSVLRLTFKLFTWIFSDLIDRGSITWLSKCITHHCYSLSIWLLDEGFLMSPY